MEDGCLYILTQEANGHSLGECNDRVYIECSTGINLTVCFFLLFIAWCFVESRAISHCVLILKRREFLPGSGFLSRHDMT